MMAQDIFNIIIIVTIIFSIVLFVIHDRKMDKKIQELERIRKHYTNGLGRFDN